jgi:hypothetical protein
MALDSNGGCCPYGIHALGLAAASKTMQVVEPRMTGCYERCPLCDSCLTHMPHVLAACSQRTACQLPECGLPLISAEGHGLNRSQGEHVCQTCGVVRYCCFDHQVDHAGRHQHYCTAHRKDGQMCSPIIGHQRGPNTVRYFIICSAGATEDPKAIRRARDTRRAATSALKEVLNNARVRQEMADMMSPVERMVDGDDDAKTEVQSDAKTEEAASPTSPSYSEDDEEEESQTLTEQHLRLTRRQAREQRSAWGRASKSPRMGLGFTGPNDQ